jgi:EAL domain-containing protein (putative c-di-GMP-specific phosphodiesterase class I)/CheY-like chemotaxis protein
MTADPIRVLIADDDADVRVTLARLFDATDGIEFVGAAPDAGGAASLAAETKPDVALVDFHMPGGGEATVRGILASSPETCIVGLSGSVDPATSLAMLQAGAASYLVKGASPDELVAAVQRAARGESILAAEVARGVMGELTAHLERSRLEAAELDRVRTRIRRVLDEPLLRPVFQPILDLRSGAPVGFEALSRFDLEPVEPPPVWFDAAEAVGLRVELELAAVERAVERFTASGRPEFLAVNASPDLLPKLGPIAAELGDRLVVEITEHAAIDDYAAIAESLRDMRAEGVRLAVDDAGAGFASFRHVLELAPEFVKLDRSLTGRIDRDARRHALALGILAFADDLGITVVAEGIENEAELRTLRSIEVGLGQGWLLAPPAALPLRL